MCPKHRSHACDPGPRAGGQVTFSESSGLDLSLSWDSQGKNPGASGQLEEDANAHGWEAGTEIGPLHNFAGIISFGLSELRLSSGWKGDLAHCVFC